MDWMAREVGPLMMVESRWYPPSVIAFPSMDKEFTCRPLVQSIEEWQVRPLEQPWNRSDRCIGVLPRFGILAVEQW